MTNIEEKMQSTVRMIEEVSKDESTGNNELKFTILYGPKEDSLELKLWVKKTLITDLELLQNADIRFVKKMRENQAVEVFRKFYRDTFN